LDSGTYTNRHAERPGQCADHPDKPGYANGRVVPPLLAAGAAPRGATGAPLLYGRNEACGLRCVYHGWKFDTSGQCADMPSEPADSDFRDKVQIDTFPVREWGGVIRAYFGSFRQDAGNPTPDGGYYWRVTKSKS
jgi:Rieske [2Fe-2S] domain